MENFNYMELLVIQEAVWCRIMDIDEMIASFDNARNGNEEGEKLSSELIEMYKSNKRKFEELLTKVESVKKATL